MTVAGRGGLAPLDARFRDGSGTLVDPTTPRIDILNPSLIEVVTDATPTRDGIGLYRYDYLVATDAPLGSWTAHWTGVINGVPVSGDESFSVVEAGSVSDEGTPYATVAQLRDIPWQVTFQEADDDQALTTLIAASNRVDRYCGTTFRAAPSTITITAYDYPAISLPLPFSDITSVTIDGTELESGDWTEEPWGLRIERCGGNWPTNDRWWFAEQGYVYPSWTCASQITITATFGYSSPPQDVIDATLILAVRRIRSGGVLGMSTTGGVSSESLQAFSRSWASQSSAERTAMLDTTGDLDADALLEDWRSRPRAQIL